MLFDCGGHIPEGKPVVGIPPKGPSPSTLIPDGPSPGGRLGGIAPSPSFTCGWNIPGWRPPVCTAVSHIPNDKPVGGHTLGRRPSGGPIPGGNPAGGKPVGGMSMPGGKPLGTTGVCANEPQLLPFDETVGANHGGGRGAELVSAPVWARSKSPMDRMFTSSQARTCSFARSRASGGPAIMKRLPSGEERPLRFTWAPVSSLISWSTQLDSFRSRMTSSNGQEMLSSMFVPATRLGSEMGSGGCCDPAVAYNDALSKL